MTTAIGSVQILAFGSCGRWSRYVTVLRLSCRTSWFRPEECTVRYPRNSIVINGTRDIPLLRQVRNSSFVSHDQLFTLLHHGRLKRSRPAFNCPAPPLLSSASL